VVPTSPADTVHVRTRVARESQCLSHASRDVWKMGPPERLDEMLEALAHAATTDQAKPERRAHRVARLDVEDPHREVREHAAVDDRRFALVVHQLHGLEEVVGLVWGHRDYSAAGSIASTASDAAPDSAAVLTTTS
jgi:hypothetical protein